MIEFIRQELFTFDLGKNIKELRLQHKLSQQQLADKVFEQQKTISNWESNKLTPSLDQLDLLCEVFDVDINILRYGNLNHRHVYVVTEQYEHKKEYIKIKHILKKAIDNYIANKHKNNKKHHYGLEDEDWYDLHYYYKHMKHIKNLKQQNKILPDGYILDHFPKNDEYVNTISMSLFQLVSFINSYLSFIEMRKDVIIDIHKSIAEIRPIYNKNISQCKKQLKDYKIELPKYKWENNYIKLIRERIALYKHKLKFETKYKKYINDWNISFIEYWFKKDYRSEDYYNDLHTLIYYDTRYLNKTNLQLSIAKINEHLNSQIT